MLTVDFRRLPIRPGMKVLDAGCGSGRHIGTVYQEDGIDAVGVDLNSGDLEKTRFTLKLSEGPRSGRWMIARSDVTGLPFRDEVFDLVICSEVLEHIRDNRTAVRELFRVLKPGGDLVVSVPRFFPERICWALSEGYYSEPGGHIRIYRKKELLGLLTDGGGRCTSIAYKHGLHAPYWWLKCLVGHKREDSRPVNLYKKFLEWDIVKRPPLTRILEGLLNPFIAKSVVFYLRKG
ncbi:MAG: Ubiquinone biosynthesis O-methyltransferase [Syntrophaceae bacterium PtaU1.Bin231]|jgi:2-polyprenyl-3-methyl-5-hydroxy-6-metoxy-1,4-benzoquinol methylase|nr:MAG: Ubiquinone biosynthesis O-methyltransferase [Syntrophaceae bacterium PtaU1.Bin231]